VTGAASGMGYEIVRGFAQSDARGIAMIDINDDLGKKVHGELTAEFPAVTFKYYHLNISEYDDVSSIVDVNRYRVKL
jgi:sorbose reductase